MNSKDGQRKMLFQKFLGRLGGPGPLAQPQHHVNGVLGALLEVSEGRLKVQQKISQI